jgi:hypothetical protein
MKTINKSIWIAGDKCAGNPLQGPFALSGVNKGIRV